MDKVFISYSHDSNEHKVRVLALADRLRKEGIDCLIDRYVEPAPSQGWPRWMTDSIENARYVILVCTENYCLRFKGKAPTGVGKGVKWEGAIVTQELYEAESQFSKYIPIVLDNADRTHIPITLRATTHYVLDSSDAYESLYRHLTQQPATPEPRLGDVRTLPPEDRPPFL